MVQDYTKAVEEEGAGKRFEVILVCYDGSQAEMDSYMRKAKMPFPGLKMSQKDGSLATAAATSEFIPFVAVLDRAGKVISTENARSLRMVSEWVD